jgi:polysaccharide biosynthesis protein PslH
MKSLLFITPELPFPAQSGGKLKSFKLLEHLGKKFDVTLCCLLKEEDTKYLDGFQAAMPCVEVIATPVCVKRNIGNLMRSYIRSEPLNVFRSASDPWLNPSTI